MPMHVFFRLCRILGATILAMATSGGPAFARSAAVPAQDRLTYLLPAPETAIAFAPFLLAERLGYYREAGLDVTFKTIPGGLNVGRALADGEGELGGALGDTLLLLRDQGVPVKGVALLGSHAFLTLMTNRDRHVMQGTLLGKKFGVPSLDDISNYALQQWLASSGTTAGTVSVSAMPGPKLLEGLVDGSLDGIVLTPDWGTKAEAAGLTLDYTSTDVFYPAMAQVVMASEATIRLHPDRIARFVHATLRALDAICADPQGMAVAYVREVPQADQTQAQIARVFFLYGRYVYGDAPVSGAFSASTFEALQRAYLQRGLVKRSRESGEFFDNRFLP